MDVFEKYQQPYQQDRLMGDPVLVVRAPGKDAPPDDLVLMLTNGRGSPVLAVTADGAMHFAPGYTPTQQAEAFRQAMNLAAQRAVFPLLPAPDHVQGS